MFDVTAPVEIAKDIFWVGYVIPNDSFQCHVYLIRNGNESILIDPGSKITWPQSREKILKLMPLEDIKYFVCQHQDPDITACVEDIFEEIGTDGRFVVTHWRTRALLNHYNWGVDFYEIEDHQWRLQTNSRTFNFIFTPYMHFPGAFCTYDETSKILFSSDIFGGFTESFQLFATGSDDYFEKMKPFHTHYMPSSIIVNHGLDNISKYALEMIAPQHGSIIKKEFISSIISKLRKLDVGLFLKFDGGKDVKFLSRADEILAELYTDVAYSTKGFEEIEKVLTKINELFNVRKAFAIGFTKQKSVIFDSSHQHGVRTDISIKKIKEEYQDIFSKKDVRFEKLSSFFDYDLHQDYMSYMFSAENAKGEPIGMINFLFDEDESFPDYKYETLKRFQSPFEILLTKALHFYQLENDKNDFFIDSITDSLTSLYNRHFLKEKGKKEFIKAKRYHYPLSVAILDIDLFKNVNDTYGHDVGDMILKDFSHHITSVIRDGDLAFRFGGEEFLLLFPYTKVEQAKRVVSRIREEIINASLSIAGHDIEYRFSAGIQELDQENSLDEMIKNSDLKLYESKRNGRDKITI